MEYVIGDDLIGLFSKGDAKAFNIIFDKLYERTRYFTRKLTNKEEGDEIALDTFAALWEFRERFKTLDHVSAFLYVTARNKCLNFLRKEEARKIFYRDFQNFSRDWEEDHVNKMIQAEILEELREEVEKLPTECRKVFKLRYYEGKSREEVAAELNIALGTVDSHTNRAFHLLRSRILRSRLSIIILILASIATLLKIFS